MSWLRLYRSSSALCLFPRGEHTSALELVLLNPEGSRGFESASLRHTVCSAPLQSGVSGKSPRGRGVCALDANRRARVLHPIGRISRVCLRAQKSRFALRFEPNSLIHRLSEIGPVAALVDSDRLQ